MKNGKYASFLMRFMLVSAVTVVFAAVPVYGGKPAGKDKPSGCDLSLEVTIVPSSFLGDDRVDPQVPPDPYSDGVDNVLAVAAHTNRAGDGYFVLDLWENKRKPAVRTASLDLQVFGVTAWPEWVPSDWATAPLSEPISMRIRALDFCTVRSEESTENIGFWMAIADPANPKRNRLIVDYGLKQGDDPVLENQRCGDMVTVSYDSALSVWTITGTNACLRDGGMGGPLLAIGDWNCDPKTDRCPGIPAPFRLEISEIP